jgi:DNA-binding transcriptional LysR family regulator
MDKVGAMTTFVHIVDAGSLTGAASTLGTSLPTVVRTLAALERHLGVSLLERTTRRIRLTDDGTQYLERCRVILSAMEDAEEALVSRRSEPAGRLAVTASALFGRRYVAPIVCDFVRRYPKVSAEMLFLDRVVNLIEEGIDVGVRIAHLRDSSMRQIQVGRTRRVVCASKEYLRRHGVPRTPADVGAHVCVRHTGLVPRSEWQFRSGNRPVTMPIASAVVCNDIDSAVNACVSGLGLGLFLSYMVAPHRKKGELEYVLQDYEVEPTPVQVVYPQTKLLSGKTRTFIDEAVAKLRRLRFD